MKRIVRFSLLAALLGTCAACEKGAELRFEEPPAGTLRSIAELKSLYRAGGCVLTQEVSVRGIVTANDRYGEFARTLVIQDADAALRIALDHAALYKRFPFGSIVTVQCNGLALGEYGGTVLLGAEPDPAYGVSRIPASDIDRRIRRETGIETPEALPLAFGEVAAGHIDRYVRFDGVRFEDPGNWCDLDPATQRPVPTEHTIVDAAGRTFVVRTAADCRYATEPVPFGTGSLYGIVGYFAGRYSLCVTDRRIVFPIAAALPTAYP